MLQCWFLGLRASAGGRGAAAESRQAHSLHLDWLPRGAQATLPENSSPLQTSSTHVACLLNISRREALSSDTHFVWKSSYSFASTLVSPSYLIHPLSKGHTLNGVLESGDEIGACSVHSMHQPGIGTSRNNAPFLQGKKKKKRVQLFT